MKRFAVAALLLSGTPAMAQVAAPPAPPAPSAPPAPPAAPVTGTAEDAEARLAIARRIVEASMPADQRDAMFANMLKSLTGTMVTSMLGANPTLREVFDERPAAARVFAEFVDEQNKATLKDFNESWPEMIDALATVYARRFSLDELVAIDRFSSTPVGARFLQSGTSLFGEPEVVAWQTGFLTRSQTRSKAALEQFNDDMKSILEATDDQPDDS